MVDIPIPFTTNAPAVDREIAHLKSTVEATSVANAKREKVMRSIIAAERAEKQATYELRREIEKLTQVQGQLGRRGPFSAGASGFVSRNPTRGMDGGIGAGGMLGNGMSGHRTIGLIGKASMLPGIGPIASSLGAIAQLGPAAGYLALAAATLAPAAVIFKRAAVKAEIAADEYRGAALGAKAVSSAYAAGVAAQGANARGSFETFGSDLLQLTARGGSASEAQRLTARGVEGAAGGLSIAQLIDSSQRGDAVAAAERAALTGEGSFTEFITALQTGQVSLTGNQTADVGALIGHKRGTVALSEGGVGALERNLSSGVGANLSMTRSTRGDLQAASMGAGLGTDAIGPYADEARAVSDPFAAANAAAMASLEEAITALQESANGQSLVAQKFALFAQRFGMGSGTQRQRANRTEAAARAAAAVP